MKNTYTPFILSGPGKILVLLATSGLLAAGIYGVTQVRGAHMPWVTRVVMNGKHRIHVHPVS